jgi:hypothetical protein
MTRSPDKEPALCPLTRAVLDTRLDVPELARTHATLVERQRDAAQRLLRQLEQEGSPAESLFRRYLQARLGVNLGLCKASHHDACADLLGRLGRRIGLVVPIASLGLLLRLASSSVERRAAQTILNEVVGAAALRAVLAAHEDAAGQEPEYAEGEPLIPDAEHERIVAESRRLLARVREVLLVPSDG